MKKDHALYSQPMEYDVMEREDWDIPMPNVDIIAVETVDRFLNDLGDPDRVRDLDEDERDEYLAELLEANDYIFDPVANVIYPLPGLDMEPAVAQAYLAGANVVIMTVADEPFLALSACGMNTSWDLVEAYITLGYLPPIHFSDLPNMGLSPDRRELAIIAEMKTSFEIVRDHMNINLLKLDELASSLRRAGGKA